MSGNVKTVSRKTKNIKDYKSSGAPVSVSTGSYSSTKRGGKKTISGADEGTSVVSSQRVIKSKSGSRVASKPSEPVAASIELPELNDAVSESGVAETAVAETGVAIAESRPKTVSHGKVGVTRTSGRGVNKSRPGSSSGNITMARSTKKVVGKNGFNLPPVDDVEEGASKVGKGKVVAKKPGAKQMQKSIVGSVSDSPRKRFGLDKPAKEKPVKEKKEKPIKEKPIKNKPVKEKPIKEKPVKEKPVKEKPIKEKPVKKPKVSKKGAAEQEIVTPKVVAKRPGGSKVVAKKPAVAKKPGAAKVVSSTPVEEETPVVAKKSAGSKVVAKKPAAKTASTGVVKNKPAKSTADKNDKVTPISKKRPGKEDAGVKENNKGLANAISENAATYRGMGILIFCIAIFVGALVLYAGKDDYFTLNAVMLFVTMLATVLASFSFAPVAIALAAISSISLLVFKIYKLVAEQVNLFDLTLLWIIVPAMAVAGMYLFMYVTKRQELDNAVLKNQVSELIMIDPTTGLYNLRSMYMDMQTQISFSVRNETPISLMIIKLRYPKEMKRILTPAQYEKVIARLSEIVVDTVRLEDRVYSLTSDGKFAILLTCDKEGTKLVESRIRSKINGNDNGMSAIASKPLRVEVKIGYEQFNMDRYNRDANSFLEDVEGEADFDMTLLEAGEWA